MNFNLLIEKKLIIICFKQAYRILSKRGLQVNKLLLFGSIYTLLYAIIYSI